MAQRGHAAAHRRSQGLARRSDGRAAEKTTRSKCVEAYVGKLVRRASDGRKFSAVPVSPSLEACAACLLSSRLEGVTAMLAVVRKKYDVYRLPSASNLLYGTATGYSVHVPYRTQVLRRTLPGDSSEFLSRSPLLSGSIYRTRHPPLADPSPKLLSFFYRTSAKVWRMTLHLEFLHEPL